MKRNIFYGLLFLLSLNLSGQDVEFTVEYPSVVNNGQQFSVTYNVNAGGGEFSVPSFNPFYKLMGPQTSYSSSTQIINGRMSTQTSYSYVYYLQATKEGTYVIPPAVFKLKGKEYRTDSMRIEVVAGNASSASSSSRKQGRAAASSPTDNEGVETSSGDLFVTLTLDRKEVYIGEPVMASIKL
ncbi:MAG TPA: BatD family protein, partial [Bacteroidales bacterium]|nr:BatD family protein [Bacteroidales bacterium]